MNDRRSLVGVGGWLVDSVGSGGPRGDLAWV
jgi:hypothetical protein